MNAGPMHTSMIIAGQRPKLARVQKDVEMQKQIKNTPFHIQRSADPRGRGGEKNSVVLGGREREAGRVRRHAVGQGTDAVGELLRKRLRVGRGELLVVTALVTVAVAATTPATEILAAVVASTTTSRARSVVAALVGLHAAADGLGRNTVADLDIGLLNDHTLLDGLTATASILGSQHPLAISLCKLADRNDANTRTVIATVARAEADAPAGLGCVS